MPTRRSLSLDLAPADQTATDPVCGMSVETTTPRGGTHSHNGTIYYFCSDGCRRKFAADADKYLSGGHQPMTAEPPIVAPVPGARYVCPMDPDVVSDRPGACPKCGMALEPDVPSDSDAPDPEQRDMTRRLIVGVVLGVPLLILAMTDMFVPSQPLAAAIGERLLVVQAVLATPIVVWCGWPLLVRAWNSVRAISPNMFTLIGLGVGVAYVYSLVALALVLSGTHLVHSLGQHELEPFFESAAWVVILVLVGQVLELRARTRTGDAVRKLVRLTPKTARVILSDGREEDRPLEMVHPGDVVRVRPGEYVPVDGTVRDGTTTVDESSLTGEPTPVPKTAAAAVMAGTVNGSGSITVTVARVGGETVLAQVIHLVGIAQRSRIPIQRLVDHVSAWFVPAVVLIAAATFAGWLWFGPPESRLVYAVVCSVSVLVIACPCALGLATPMALVVGIGRAAGQGVLFRDAAALERLGSVDAVVFDKTGTLTVGRPKILSSTIDDAALVLAASVEQASEHPLATAIVKHATEERRLTLRPAQNVQATAGQGVRGTVDNRVVLAGNLAYLQANGLSIGKEGEALSPNLPSTGTIVYVAIDGKYEGYFVVGDELRPESAAAVASLTEAGIRVVMLTGDRKAAAEAMAKQVGIHEVIAETLPADKYKAIEKLKAEGRVVAMVGDGINDAPALAAADVGIALGTGTDVAVTAAGVTLVRPDLRGVVAARELSRATIRSIRQNLGLAFVYNVLAIPVAAGLLVPFGGSLIGPVWAAAAMSLSSVSVILNSLRPTRPSAPATTFRTSPPATTAG
ncbi:heavy metal translocating P-type ATPase [Fimbriiglobus ruber]|uniref:Lead, cadmium, zinc and mercury transporting ATPase n=1 Tax=Fimbriiglobus ruber TaxID=1908690 RepID=A0A225E841_9BACT|nr:heavy metal translocating P-type ATPase [Fimbriiglobus ruber]OWK46938.1 Lead, cadmium, zinc and mercury transporting ATPase [Fimbriiglobus ruber]